jgi:metallo-beta-lactamase class B
MKKSILIVLAFLGGWICLNGFGQMQPAPKPSAATNAPGRLPVSQDKIAASRMFDSWKSVMPPRHIIGNIYYVGMSGVCSWLITTPDGDILIDSTFEECVPQISKNIEQLGFHVGDVKWILSSHAHVDHTGGHALLKKLSGARIAASAADAHVLETGGADDFSPFPKELLAYKPVKADRIVKDGDVVSLGGVSLTAHLTPGHTKGATTWTMQVQDGGQTYNVVFFSSVSIVPPTRLVNNPDYPNIAEDYATTFKTLKSLPCDIFFAPHGDQFGLDEKLQRLEQGASPNPFIDPAGWHRLITNTENAYTRQLASEKVGQ